MQPALVDGAFSVILAGGQLSRALKVTIARGRITWIEVIAAPERLRHLDLAIPEEAVP